MDDRADRHKTRLDDIDAKISALGEQVRKTSDKSEVAAFEAEITKLKEERELRLAILDLKEKQHAANE